MGLFDLGCANPLAISEDGKRLTTDVLVPVCVSIEHAKNLL
jgi:hypothetical protein